jgi:hypothetical protein
MKAFRILSASLWLAACASEVSPEEIERAKHQPYDDESQVQVTQQALGAVETIAEVCKAQCGSLAMGSSTEAAVITEQGGDTIRRVLIGTGQTLVQDTNHQLGGLIQASDLTLYYRHKVAGVRNHRVVRIDAAGLTWMFDGIGAIQELMVDATNLYFIDDAGLRKRGRAAGPRLGLVPAAEVGRLLGIDGTKLYFSNKAGNQLRSVENNAPANMPIASIPIATIPIGVFAQDSTRIYNFVDSYIYIIEKASFARQRLFIPTINHVFDAVAKDGVVYFLDAPSVGGISEVSLKRLSGGSVTTVERPVEQGMGEQLMSLKIVGNYLYWLEQATVDAPTYLMRAPL